MQEVRDRVTFQRADGKGQEIDLFAADGERVLCWWRCANARKSLP